MTLSYDDAAYFVDRAVSLLSVGDVEGAVEEMAAYERAAVFEMAA